MNTKTSYFNVTILKKDLTRFMPLWAIYLVLGMMLIGSYMGISYHTDTRLLSNSLYWIGVVLCLYALIVAQMLFGDLFQGRMCNAIHALPVRREGLFLTHFTAGLIMGIVPLVPMALLGMANLEKFWFVALLWLGGAAMMYLLFFGIAVLCMMCSGNRFAGVALYVMVNLLGIIVMWIFEAFYLPLLYGIEMNDFMRNMFYIFSPVAKLMKVDWIDLEHAADCPVDHNLAYINNYEDCIYHLESYGNGWGYLGIVAALGLVFAAAALLLYRKRHLETAGDFLSFKPIGLLFTLIATVCIGGLFYYIAGEIFLGLIVGLPLGFFACRMLLERTIKVFNKKSWVQFVVFALIISLSYACTYFDVLGITRRIPDAEDVKSVTMGEGHLPESRLENIDMAVSSSQIVTVAMDPSYQFGKDGQMTLRKPEDIQQMVEIHKLLLEEGDAGKNIWIDYNTITIHYVLKNGTTLTRYYRTASNSPAMQKLEAYMCTPQFILGFDTPEDMAKYMWYVNFWGEKTYSTLNNTEWMEKLANALFEDAAAGRLQADKDGYVLDVDISFAYPDERYGGLYLGIPKTATSTLQWLEEYDQWSQTNHEYIH